MSRNTRPRMIIALTFILCVATGQSSWGQDASFNTSVPAEGDMTQLSASQEVEGYIGEIIGNDINIRSGPAQVYYRVGKLRKGRKVIVRKELFDLWAKIEPTVECFSYISKEFVELQGDADLIASVDSGVAEGDTARAALAENTLTQPLKATVTGENVRVRAGSMGSVKPANADEVQVKLSKGAEVLVIGQRDAYYKIVPPENCYFWVSKQFVKRLAPATQFDIDRLRRRINRVGTVTENGETPVPSLTGLDDGTNEAIGLPGSERVLYRQAEELFRAELAKPLGERSYKEINEKIEYLIKNSVDPSVQAAAEMLKQQVQRAELALAAWNRSKQQNDTFNEVLARIREKVELLVAVNDPPQKKEEEVVVQGRVEESAIFTSPNKNRRYLILDDQDKIIYYAVSGKENLDLSDWLEKRVSLVGTAKYDSFSQSRLLSTTHIVELPGEAELQKTN